MYSNASPYTLEELNMYREILNNRVPVAVIGNKRGAYRRVPKR